AEKALIWERICEEVPDEEYGSFLKQLDIPNSAKVQKQYQAAAGLPHGALLALARNKLDLETAASLASLGRETPRVWDLMEILAPSLQSRKQSLEWLQDLRRREKTPLAKILEEISSTLSREASSGPDRFRELLWQRRFPKLSKLAAQRQEILARLKLPQKCLLETDPSLEDLLMTLKLSFVSPQELEESLAALQKVSRSAEFHKLWTQKWPE
ncbi:MAG: hypothetical protein LBK52_05710, partial [Deltaproteobacteria bacterium]|nr:hypothetical protein [Deltaproteobacteria bacterium]